MKTDVKQYRYCRQLTDFEAPDWLFTSIGWAGKLLSPFNHRGFWRICHFLSRFIKEQDYFATLLLNDDSQMKIWLDDAYWAQLVAKSYQYEPDFFNILHKLNNEQYTFVDCGANFGYWSILASSKALNNRRVLAIEAFEPTFEHLVHNAKLNNKRFHCLHRAISNRSGQRVWIGHSGDHAGATMNPDADSPKSEHQAAVLTTTIDDAIANSFETYPEKLVVKLDVEGQEINALKGSPHLWDKDTLLYYEDHGHDETCEVTRFILKELKLKIYFVKGDKITPINSIEDARSMKKRKTYGYNFFACKANSSFLSVFQQLNQVVQPLVQV